MNVYKVRTIQGRIISINNQILDLLSKRGELAQK